MYQLKKTYRYIKITASASYTSMEKMCFEVEKFSKEMKFDNRHFALMICLREALTNAIRHGCKNDESKEISMEMNYDKNLLQFTITDEGDGFNWKDVDTTESSQLQTSGRGCDIMKVYSDKFYYNEIGNQITILIRNE